MLTLEEAAETFRRLLPLGMSAHQALNLMNPVGKALAQKEDEVVKALFEEAVKSMEEGSGGQAHHVIEHPHMCLASIEPASWWGVVVVGSDAREIWVS